MRPRTDRQTRTHTHTHRHIWTRVTTIHFTSSTTHAKYNKRETSLKRTICLETGFYYISRESYNDAKCIVVTRVGVCVSVRGRMPTLFYGPGCNLGSGRGMPLVVNYWADLQSVHGLRCYGNITRTLVTSLPPPGDMTTYCEREMLASALYSLYA